MSLIWVLPPTETKINFPANKRSSIMAWHANIGFIFHSISIIWYHLTRFIWHFVFLIHVYHFYCYILAESEPDPLSEALKPPFPNCLSVSFIIFFLFICHGRYFIFSREKILGKKLKLLSLCAARDNFNFNYIFVGYVECVLA